MRRWRLADRATLIWREWDGEYVVRDERTGDTHLLDAQAGAIFAYLFAMTAGATTAEIANNRLSGYSELEVGPDVEAVLLELERIGLVSAETVTA